MTVMMRLNFPAGHELRRHCTDDCATCRIMLFQYFMHDRHGDIRDAVPARLLANVGVRPVRCIREDQNDRLSLVVDVIRLLAEFILMPGSFFLAQDGFTQSCRVDGAELAQWSVYIQLCSQCEGLGKLYRTPRRMSLPVE